MNARQAEVLDSMLYQRDAWARPMDIGGRDGSHHSATLRQLARRGWVLAKKLHSISCWFGTTKRSDWDADQCKWIETDGHPPAPCRCKGSITYHISRRALLFCYERIE